MCVCIMRVPGTCGDQTKGVESSGTEAAGGCGPLDVGARNKIRVFVIKE